MCTLEKQGNIFILTLTGDDEHRLNPTLIDSIRSALSTARSQATSSSALITTAHGKFFSNGFDLAWASKLSPSLSGSKSSEFISRLHTLVESLKPVVADFLSLPMPTIAAVTGHAAAAGFLLALSHDYFLMRNDRGVLYMSELDIGMTLPEYFAVLFREKVGSPAARRDVFLKATKIKAEEAVKLGIVDAAYGSGEEVVRKAVVLGEELVGRKWNGEIYGEIRKSLYPETCKMLGLETRAIVAPRL